MATKLKESPIIFSFFSGAGFLDLGFEASGFEIVYVNEIHKPFLDAYAYSRMKMGMKIPRYGYHNCDINLLLSEEAEKFFRIFEGAQRLGRLIGFIGGPPCPDFSVAGKNKGGHGENGKLSRSYIDLICRCKPDFFVFENVKGLYRTAKHREFFNELSSDLQINGYACTERLVNSINYGVAQDRERIILFGTCIDPLKECIDEFDWDVGAKYPNIKLEDLKLLSIGDSGAPLHLNKIPEDLTVQYWFAKNKVESHPNASHHFTPRAGLKRFETVLEGDDSRKSYKRLHRWRYSPTAAYGNNEVHIHPTLPRRISVAEALAIQSLPKEYEFPFGMTLTNMFKTVGNGVPYLAACGIAASIQKFFDRKKL